MTVGSPLPGPQLSHRRRWDLLWFIAPESREQLTFVLSLYVLSASRGDVSCAAWVWHRFYPLLFHRFSLRQISTQTYITLLIEHPSLTMWCSMLMWTSHWNVWRLWMTVETEMGLNVVSTSCDSLPWMNSRLISLPSSFHANEASGFSFSSDTLNHTQHELITCYWTFTRGLTSA